MDSVYDAVLKHADALKAELKSLQSYIDLHDHFRERFGLTAPAATSESSPTEAEAPPVEASADAPAEIVASNHEDDAAHDLAAHAATGYETPETSSEAAFDEEPHVIQASEGVLIASDGVELAPATGASHPLESGYAD